MNGARIAARAPRLLLWLFAPLGALSPNALAPLLFVAGLGGLIGPDRRPRLIDAVRQPPGLALAGLVAWAALSALWAPAPDRALIAAGKLCAVALAFIALRGLRPAGPHWARGVPIAFAVAAAVLAFEVATGAAGHRAYMDLVGKAREFEFTILNRPLAVLLLASFPAGLVLARLRGAGWALLPPAVAAVIVAGGASHSDKIAAVAGLVVFAAAWLAGRRLLRALAVLAGAGILSAPLWPRGPLDPDRWAALLPERFYSGEHRLIIWRFSAERIGERPWRGWGMDASRIIPGGDQPLAGGGQAMMMHPHNAALQVWLELGLIGAGLAALALAAGIWRSAPPDRIAAACLGGLIASALAIAHLSYGIWQTWWMAALAGAALTMRWTLTLPRRG